MQKILFTLFTFAAVSCVSGDLYPRWSDDSNVAICDSFDICNIVHNPFWGSNSVEKLCKCPEGNFCPATFLKNDGYSVSVNVRTQMKFCTPVIQVQAQMEPCGEADIAIRVRTLYHIDQVKNTSASMMCSCEHDGPIYWKYHSRVGRNIVEDEKLFEVVDNFQCSGEDFIKILRNEKQFKTFQSCGSATRTSFAVSPDSTSVSSSSGALATHITTVATSPRSRKWRRTSSPSFSTPD